MIKLVLVLLALALAVNADVWIDSALSFQRSLSSSTPVNEISRPCAHQSFNNPDALPPIIRQYQDLILFKDVVVFNNQDWTHTQLLEAGVRQLQIEVHFVPLWNLTLVCHHQPSLLQFCPFVEAGTGGDLTCEEISGLVDLDIHTGCTLDSRTWEEEISEIADWVRANPNDVVVIEIIDHVTEEPTANATQFATPLIDLLGAVTLTNTLLAGGWPTPAEMASVNKSVIFSGSSFPELADYMVDLHSNVQYPDNMAVNFTGSCDVPPQFTSYYESLTKLVLNILGYDIHYDESDVTGSFGSEKIEQAVACGYSACVDLVDDAKLASNIWTWPTGVSNIACQANQCALLAKDEARWSQQPCNGTFAFACKSEIGTWSVTGPSDTQDADEKCLDGFTFAVPQTPLENAALKTELANNPDVNGVWLSIDLVLDSTHGLCTAVYTPPNGSASLSSSLFITLGALVVSVIFAMF